jgi:hypothetical protein
MLHFRVVNRIELPAPLLALLEILFRLFVDSFPVRISYDEFRRLILSLFQLVVFLRIDSVEGFVHNYSLIVAQ